MHFSTSILYHRIVSPSSLPSDSISAFQISSDLVLGQPILPSPIGTGRPGSELVPSVFTLAEDLLHIQRSWLSKHCRRVHCLLPG